MNATRSILVMLFVTSLGCSRDPDGAARAGSAFLRQVLIEHRYDDAARTSGLSPSELRALAGDVERKLGPVVDARAMSSAPALEPGALFVWYRLEAAHAAGNVGLLVARDGRRRFTVNHVHVNAKPAPGRWPGRPFDAPIPM